MPSGRISRRPRNSSMTRSLITASGTARQPQIMPIKQSILSQGLASPEEMQKTTDSLSALLEASQNADGIVGVTQAASQIAGLQVQEMQRMEAIMADSMKGQNLYLKKLMQSDEASAKLAEEFYQNNDLKSLADTNYTERTADFER